MNGAAGAREPVPLARAWHRSPGARAVRAFVWLCALVPFLSHRFALFEARDGSWSLPLLRALGGEDLFWLAVVALDLVRVGGRRRRLVAAAAAAVWLALALNSFRSADVARGEADFTIRTPVGFGAEEADWSLIADPAVTLPAPPSARHWLGTDLHGRDLLARLLHGTRVSLGVGVAATAIALVVGLLVGLACGTLRGAVDRVLMRLIEILLCFPHLFLVLVVFAYVEHSRATLVLLLGLVGWTTTARLARGELLRLHDAGFVVAARALGASPARLALRHFLPNALAPVLVAATFSVAGAMLAEFALSWLGLGVAPPTPSLGQVLAEGQQLLARGDPSIAIAPGLLIFAVVMSFNAWGEALRVATTPERAGAAPGAATGAGP